MSAKSFTLAGAVDSLGAVSGPERPNRSRVAGVKLAQTAIDLDGVNDLPDILDILGLRTGTPVEAPRASLTDPKALGPARRQRERKVSTSQDNQPMRTNAAKCGTPSGHRAHLRRGEDPCRPCRDAENTKRREVRRKKREASA